MEISMRFLQNIKMELPYPKECAPGYNRALFTVAKLWKQYRCPTTGEWVKKIYYICTVEYYSAVKKDDIMFCR
jgi:hypothetical protein